MRPIFVQFHYFFFFLWLDSVNILVGRKYWNTLGSTLNSFQHHHPTLKIAALHMFHHHCQDEVAGQRFLSWHFCGQETQIWAKNCSLFLSFSGRADLLPRPSWVSGNINSFRSIRLRLLEIVKIGKERGETHCGFTSCMPASANEQGCVLLSFFERDGICQQED